MNNNPIFGNYRSRMVFGGIWMFVTAVQTAIVHISGLPFRYAFADSVMFNFLLACCLIHVWYPVRFNLWKRDKWHINIALHLVLICIVLITWLPAGYVLRYFIGPDTEIYRHFLNMSLWWKALEGILFYIVVVLVYYLCAYVEQLNEKAANEIRLNRLVKDSELNLLKSQINPHFLFNSMNSVNSLIIRNPEQAQKMLVALSDYLRYAVLSTNRVYSCVADEMENIAHYLSIEQLRFGEKLLYEPEIEPSCLNAKLPAMLLQPLFENAIKHGVYESLETVRIITKIKRDNSYLHIELSNNFDEDGVSMKKGSGTGLRNIRERLRLLYGTSAAMQSKAENGVFTVVLKIPFTN